MSYDDKVRTGGCQCGAVRFRVSGIGRPMICYCRMCQKAFGSVGGPLVGVTGMTWTRGRPAHFQSSNIARRGFCADCGTPLTFESAGEVELAIGTFDAGAEIAPTLQLGVENKPAWVDHLGVMPTRTPEQQAKHAIKYGTVVSHQHPDHDTGVWPPAEQEK